MTENRNADMPLDERRDYFHETYGNYFDAGWTLTHLVQSCGKFLEKIVGPNRANAAMAEAIGDLVDLRESPNNWHEVLDDAGTDAFSAWPLGQELHDLTAYAIFGFIFKDGGTEKERREFLEGKINLVTDFFDQAPIKLWSIEEGPRTDLELLVTLVRNRWALDKGEAVEPFALAYFGDITEGSIRNMMSGKNAKFTNDNGKIPANEALTWLATRNSFWNSIWQEVPEPYFSQSDEASLQYPIFVPVARDGSVFHPGLRRGGGFTIGKKGSEQQEDSFESSLYALQKMRVPYWRRPNDQGNFGIVRGVRWARLDRSFLQSAAENPSFRLPDTLGH